MRSALGCGLMVLLLGGNTASLRAQDRLFDPSFLHDTRIVLDPGDWKALQENFLTNQYYAANLTVDGETVQQVGIRSRGEGSRSSAKPGLKVDFNKYVPSQEFHGYKSLVLDNLTQDPSFLKERLAFAVFEAMGIPAPRVAHTRLTVNGEYWGLYTLVEPVSKPFLRQRLGEDGGNLFDYEWVENYYFTFKGSDPTLYVPRPFEPETNEDSLDSSGLVAFIRVVNEAPAESFASAVSGFLEVEEFLTYLAVENALAENDGFLGFAGMNNFYLYQYGGQNRFTFIPWDKDTAFQEESWPLFQRVEENVITRRLFEDPALQRTYANQVLRAVDSFVNREWLLPQLEAAYGQIREAALVDPHKPFSNEEFELAVLKLTAVIESRRADVHEQANGSR
jgi:spore coat protein CotH